MLCLFLVIVLCFLRVKTTGPASDSEDDAYKTTQLSASKARQDSTTGPDSDANDPDKKTTIYTEVCSPNPDDDIDEDINFATNSTQGEFNKEFWNKGGSKSPSGKTRRELTDDGDMVDIPCSSDEEEESRSGTPKAATAQEPQNIEQTDTHKDFWGEPNGQEPMQSEVVGEDNPKHLTHAKTVSSPNFSPINQSTKNSDNELEDSDIEDNGPAALALGRVFSFSSTGKKFMAGLVVIVGSFCILAFIIVQRDRRISVEPY